MEMATHAARPTRMLLTKRKIHDAREMEPKTPDSASWAVKEMLWNMIALVLGCLQQVARKQLAIS